MGAARNPFEHLIPPQQGQAPEQPDQGMNNPMPNQGNPFEKLVPPEQKEEMVDTFLGKLPKNPKQFQPGTPENKEEFENMLNAAVGGPGMQLVGRGAMSFGKGISSLLNRVAPKEMAYGVQKAHDLMQKKLTGMYEFVKDQALKRGIGQIKVTPTLFEEAEKHLPKTQKYRDLINKARNGDYESLHQLQSDLGKKGTAAKSAATHAERNAGEEMLDTRKQINSTIQSHMKNTGNTDLSDTLKEASKGYRDYKKLYYSHPRIAKLVHEESRLVPKNPLNLFTEESKKMDRLINAHPDLAKALEHERNAGKFIKNLKTGKGAATTLGLIGGGAYGIKTLKDIFNKIGGE